MAKELKKVTKKVKSTKIVKKELSAKDRKKVAGGDRREIGYLFGQYKKIKNIKELDVLASMNEMHFKSKNDLWKHFQDVGNGDGSITVKYEND